MKHWLAVVFSLALLSAGAVVPGSKEDYELGRKMMAEMRNVKRTPALPKPLFFIRTQTKYSGRLHKSRYEFDDRPLFNDRALAANGPEEFHTVESFAETMRLYELTGVDGICTFAWYGEADYRNMLSPMYQAAEKSRLSTMLEFHPSNMKVLPQTLALIDEHPHALIVNGKRLVSSYVADSAPPEKIEAALKDWNSRSKNKIGFLPQLFLYNISDGAGKIHNGYTLYDIYRKHGTLPATLIDNIKTYLRRYLEFSEGLYVAPGASTRELCSDPRYLDEVLMPIFRSVLAEPAYNGKKILAMQGKVGYTCYAGCQTLLRDGTATLRGYLNSMKKSGADLFIGTEWDELNEDTGFEPLVSKPMSTQRIMRAFIAQLRGEKIVPLPGDDVTLPDLIVSFRRMIRPGMKVAIELLNVPDPSRTGKYEVLVALLDENGRELAPEKSFTLDPSAFDELKLEMASEGFADARVVRPRITIVEKGKRTILQGMPPTIVRSVADDQQFYCIPARNLLKLKTCELNWDAAGVIAKLDAGEEKLSSVEILQNEREVFAYDAYNEFLQDDPDRVLFRFKKLAYNPAPRLMADITLEVLNAPSLIAFTPNEDDFSKPVVQRKSFPKQINQRVDWWEVPRFYFSLKKEDLAKAVFKVTLLRRTGKNAGKEFVWEVPLAAFGNHAVKNTVSEDGIALTLQDSPPPRIQPLAIGKGAVEFTGKALFDDPNGVNVLRVISKSGKVYWSVPFVQKKAAAGKSAYCALSATTGKYERIPIDRSRLPQLKYDLSAKDCWIVAPAGEGKEFWAMAGSFISVATDFQGCEANVAPYQQMFNFGSLKGIAARPDRTETDGKTALKFDGKSGHWLFFPKTLLPLGAGFTIDMTVIPENLDNDPVLLHNGPSAPGGLKISVRNRRLVLDFIHRTPYDPKAEFYTEFHYPTELALASGKPQRIIVSYDGYKLCASVNGRSEGVELAGAEALYNQFTNFGGTPPDHLFAGILTAFEVRHEPADFPGAKILTRAELDKRLRTPTASFRGVFSAPVTQLSFAEWGSCRLLSEKERILTLPNRTNLVSQKIIEIDSDATYILSGEYRNGSDRPGNLAAFGFILFDRKMKQLSGWNCSALPATLTHTQRDAKTGDTKLTLAAVPAWSKISWTWLQLNAKADLGDLPNAEALQIKSSAVGKAGISVELAKPLTRAIPGGTAVRQAPRASAYLTTELLKVDAPWQRFTLTVKGCAKNGTEKGRWWPGAAYAQVILMANMGGKEPCLQFRNVRLEIQK